MLPYTSLIYSGADKVIAHWVPGFHGYHQFFLREILFLSSLPFPTHTLLKKKKSDVCRSCHSSVNERIYFIMCTNWQLLGKKALLSE